MSLLRRSKTVLPRQSTRRRCRPCYEVLEDRIDPATFQVADVTGLLAAISAVNTNPSQQATINMAPGTYDLTSELQIVNASKLTIHGGSPGKVVIDNPTHAARIFDIEGGNVTIDSLTITGGNASGFYPTPFGGGIYAQGGTLTVVNSTISGNTANQGGGIDVEGGTLTVNQSTISGNTAGFLGGGIDVEDGTLTVNQSTISDNTAARGGGTYAQGGTLTVNQSTISDNTAAGVISITYGGGIDVEGGTLTVNQSTISGNTANAGSSGGISNSGTLTVNQSTISDNTAASGGGGISTSWDGDGERQLLHQQLRRIQRQRRRPRQRRDVDGERLHLLRQLSQVRRRHFQRRYGDGERQHLHQQLRHRQVQA